MVATLLRPLPAAVGVASAAPDHTAAFSSPCACFAKPPSASESSRHALAVGVHGTEISLRRCKSLVCGLRYHSTAKASI